MNRLDKKTVFITGGASGIGLACAIAAAKESANVVIADLSSSQVAVAMQEIQKYNPKALYIECNVADFNQVESAIKQTIEIFGSLDVAVNNAGIGGIAGKVGDMSPNDWQKVLDVNLNGVFYCMKHELIQMTKQNSGVIINMSSILGKVGFANSSHYVASKHAMLGLTKSAALEYAGQGIRINAICPGFIETPMLTNAGIKKDTDIQKQIIALHPLQRMGKPEEIASAFVFLASDESTFMTGAAIDVEGGYLIQ